MQSVIIPTIRYPLNGPCEVFTAENTEKVIDINILNLMAYNQENFKNLDIDEARKALMEFHQEAQKQKNSVRCWPVGQSNFKIHPAGITLALASF